MHYSESDHEILHLHLARLSHPILQLVSIRLGRTHLPEMIIAPRQWFHYSMRCHCCRTLFGPIE
jgi:hypothetical protein